MLDGAPGGGGGGQRGGGESGTRAAGLWGWRRVRGGGGSWNQGGAADHDLDDIFR